MCLSKCGHRHPRIIRVIYLTANPKKEELKREFRIYLVERHFKKAHQLGKTAAVSKKEQDFARLERKLVDCMSDAVTGNYCMFQRKTFKEFFEEACRFSKNYREIPDLNFNRKSVMNRVKQDADEKMKYLRTAINTALSNQTTKLNAGVLPKEQFVVTMFMDHVFFKEMRKKVGLVSLMIRISSNDQNNQSNHYSIPIYAFDTNDESYGAEATGTTGDANAYHFNEALKFIDKEYRHFIGGCFDGAIFDRKKLQFINKLQELGQKLVDVLFFTCCTHSTGLKVTLSISRIMRDFGLKYEGADEEPDQKRKSPDVIWFGEKEKEEFQVSFKTFNTISKLLAVKSKERGITFADYVYLIAQADYNAHKRSDDINPQRTNSIYWRWKTYYLQLDNQQEPSQRPIRMIKENDKKLRRYYHKSVKLLENIPYVNIAMRHEFFKQHFLDIKPQPKISADFEHQIAQWCALVTLLWSINDSSEEGHNCSLLRDLMIVLKAATEETPHNDPLSNVFLR